MTSDEGRARDASGQRPMPGHVQLFDVLSGDERSALLAWAMSNEAAFTPARVYRHGAEQGDLDSGLRSALKLRDLGPLRPMLEKRLFGYLDRIVQRTGYRGGSPDTLEFELNAYGDGGYFKPHIDVLTGVAGAGSAAQARQVRVLSAVYYFYDEPKGFAGGDLRLFRFGSAHDDLGKDDVVTFEPHQNSLVAFPSMASHEVSRVACPTGRFSDYRFALNCWFCRGNG